MTALTEEPLAEWHVMVSATTGSVLAQWDQLMHDSGSGQVYNPNAVQQSNDTTLRDNSDATGTALDNARISVTLSNLDGGTNKLKGAYADLTGTGISQSATCSLPYTPGTADESSRTYNYTRDDDRFEEVNAYAAIDGVQQWIQSLGFTNVNNRSIPVDVHCLTADNSNYSPSDHAAAFRGWWRG